MTLETTDSPVNATGSPHTRRLSAAVFDFGGVMTYPVIRPLPEAAPELAAIAAFFLRELREVYALTDCSHDLHLLETGRLTETAFFTNLCRRYETAGNPSLDPETVREAIFRRQLVACEAMVETVRCARTAGYRTALLTNNAREWESTWRSVIPVEELFEVVVDSSAVGLRKPDPAIYRLTCERLGLEPADCLFVDDLECNVDAARDLGMDVLVCRHPEQAAAEVALRLGLDARAGG